jgi:hypothetical protein
MIGTFNGPRAGLRQCVLGKGHLVAVGEKAEIDGFDEGISSEARAEREVREAPIRAAQANLNKFHQQVAELQRKRLTDPVVKDIDVFIDREVAGASMRISEAREWNLNHQ